MSSRTRPVALAAEGREERRGIQARPAVLPGMRVFRRGLTFLLSGKQYFAVIECGRKTEGQPGELPRGRLARPLEASRQLEGAPFHRGALHVVACGRRLLSEARVDAKGLRAEPGDAVFERAGG